MHLQNCPLKFSSITHHANVTQCLGAAIDSNVWYLAVAKPSVVDSNEIENDSGKTIVKSRSGHFYVPPAIEDVQVFKVSGPKFLKLNRGTWHAGPLFTTDAMNFYNLELTNTNVSFPPEKFISNYISLFYGLVNFLLWLINYICFFYSVYRQLILPHTTLRSIME
jgi:hypothetical protein